MRPRRAALALLAAAVLPMAPAPRVIAQPLPDPLPERRGAAPALPDRTPALPADAAPRLDAAPVPGAMADIAPDDALFVLRGVRIEGSTVLGGAEAEELARPFLGRPVGPAAIEEIRRAATLLYVQRGFVSSGVLVPDQTVEDGILLLRAVEGRIAEVEVGGTRMLRPGWVRAQLAQGLGTPFDIAALERQQQLMLRDPFLSRLNLAVEPGLEPGEARLRAEVTEELPVRVTLGLANTQPGATGGLRGSVQGIAWSVLGVGDLLALQYGRTEGVDDYALSWSAPVLPDDTRVNLRLDRNRAGVVDPALRALDITSRYDGVSLGVTRPFLRTPEGALTLGAAVDWRRSRTGLLGQPFNFSPGAVDGETTVVALRLSQDWLRQGAEQVVALRSTFSIGLDAFGATDSPGGPRAGFLAWLGQGQVVRRLYEGAEGLLRGTVQLSADPLFTLEQFPLGGFATVRGYRENRLATDNAVAGTAELRLPIASLPLPFVEQAPGIGLLQLVPFLDGGQGWNTDRPSPAGSTLLSAGVGLRWRPGAASLFEVYYGRPLRGSESGNTWQEQGISFRLTLGLP